MIALGAASEDIDNARDAKKIARKNLKKFRYKLKAASRKEESLADEFSSISSTSTTEAFGEEKSEVLESNMTTAEHIFELQGQEDGLMGEYKTATMDLL